MTSTPKLALLPAIHPNRIIKWAGQAWITEPDLTGTKYEDPRVGDIIRVQGLRSPGQMAWPEDVYYELAAQVATIPRCPKLERARTDFPGDWLVFWLQPILDIIDRLAVLAEDEEAVAV